MIIETLPAGKYLLGDPSYAFNEQSWKVVLSNGLITGINEDIGHVSRFAGRKLLAFMTDTGAGTFEDGEGRKYACDSGLIGMVPIESATYEHANGMYVVDFPDGVTCRNNDGVLLFGGNICIDTRSGL